MKSVLTLVLFLASCSALAECNKPEVPLLPDGNTADLQAMIDGQKAVKTYVAGTEAYLECLNVEEQETDAEADSELVLQRIDEHNAAVDEMEKVAADFNEEIREYKAKSR